MCEWECWETLKRFDFASRSRQNASSSEHRFQPHVFGASILSSVGAWGAVALRSSNQCDECCRRDANASVSQGSGLACLSSCNAAGIVPKGSISLEWRINRPDYPFKLEFKLQAAARSKEMADGVGAESLRPWSFRITITFPPISRFANGVGTAFCTAPL